MENIFDHTMQMEWDGEKYYRELADKALAKGLKGILTMLAEDEVKHFNVFKEMKEQEAPEVSETDVLMRSKNVFSQMQEQGEKFDFDISEKELYQKAQGLEKETEDFYLQQSKETTNPKHKQIFLKIAEEERKHYFLLENIIDFISTPETWLENSEFTHLDEG
ncbi:MAG: ferritin family protein [Candidatus Omnitrophota bacterium]